jgi:hypothetical protein
MKRAGYFVRIPRLYFWVEGSVPGFSPTDSKPEETSDTMDEHLRNARLLARLRKSYADRGNTLTWALFIWSFTAVGFALFLPFEATLLRSVGVAVGWSAFHLIRGL